MTTEYKISYHTYLEAQKAVLGSRLRLAWIIGGLFILFGLLQLFLTPEQYPTSLAFILLGGIFAFCWRLSVRRTYRRDGRFQKSYFVTISPEEVEIRGANGTSKYSWSAFTSYKQTKNAIVLFQAPLVFNAFPKSAFAEPDWLFFVNLIEKNVPRHVQKGDRIRAILMLIITVLALVLLVLAIRNILR